MYSFIQLSELEQCRVKILGQGFNTAARIRIRVLLVESPKLSPELLRSTALKQLSMRIQARLLTETRGYLRRDAHSRALVNDSDPLCICLVHDLLCVRVVGGPETVHSQPLEHCKVPRNEGKVKTFPSDLATCIRVSGASLCA